MNRAAAFIRSWKGAGPDAIAQVAAIAGIGLVWWAAASSGTINPYLLPAPGNVLGRLLEELANGRLLEDLTATLWRSFAGFAMAVLIGVPIGLFIVRSAIAKWLFDPVVSIGFPAPKIAFMPVFMLWFGIGDLSKIVLITISCLFIIISATVVGAAGVGRIMIWSARSLGAPERSILTQIVVPAALPQIINGIQVALPIALISAIGAEMLTGGVGLGGSILSSGRMADTTGVYAGLIACCALGFALLKCAEFCRRRALHWHPESSTA